MPSLGKIAKTAAGFASKAGKPNVQRLDWAKTVQKGPGAEGGLPPLGDAKSWSRHVKAGKGAVYELPEGLDDVVDVKGYIKLIKDGKKYLVRKDFAQDFAKQENKQLKEIK